jgi:putative ABC transport system permease protein
MFGETIWLALRTIARNKLRSFLTVLGIVIGIASVIALVTIGQGSSAQVSANIASLGTNMLIIRPGKPGMGPGPRDGAATFRIKDAEALAGQPLIETASPSVSRGQTAVFGNTNSATQITGTDSDYLSVNGWQLAGGRLFSEGEEKAGSAACIIGETVRRELFGDASPLGQTIRIKRISCAVIGLLKAKGAGTFGNDQDDLILMPIKAVQRRITGNADVQTIYAKLTPDATTATATEEIQTLMRERRRIERGEEDDFNVTDLKQITSALSGINGILTGLLTSIAGISLLVGGIGIMNIMLVSVTERTREIGIRLAIGATARQVLAQFLIEAVVLSLIGGLIGVLLGLGLAAVGSSFMAIPFAPDPAVVAMAFAFAAAVGIAFGFFPARKAARLDPIEALRYQ